MVTKLGREDVRLLQTLSLFVVAAFITIFMFVVGGYLTEKRRISEAHLFNSVSQASAEIGTISQKIALLQLGLLGKRDSELMHRLSVETEKELIRFERAREALEQNQDKSDLQSSAIQEKLSTLIFESGRFRALIAELKIAITQNANEREAASRFAEHAVALLDLSRTTGIQITQEAEQQAAEAQSVVRRFYLLTGCAIIFTAIIVIVLLIVRLKRELLLRRSMEQRLVTANEELERFSAVVAHDLKAPLSTISISARMLTGERHVNDDLTSMIAHETERLQTMVQALLRLFHVQTNVERTEDVKISEVIQEIQESLSQQLRTAHATIKHFGDDCIAADKVLVHNLFQNLIENSIKYRETGTDPRIVIASTCDVHGTTVQYDDNGMGIEPEMRERVFDPFVQSSSAIIKAEGVGLGLSVVKKIILSHGGTIRIEPKEEPGTRFIMTFPRELPSAYDAGLGA